MIANFRLAAMLVRAAFVTAVAIAAGCSFTREAPIKQVYLVDAPLPPAAAKAHEGALRVGAVRVAAPFRGKNIVVREGDLRYQNDFYVEFLVPPAPMLNEQTARAMSAANVFTRVVPPGAYGQADYVLEGFVSELYGDVHAGTPAAVVTVTYFLRRANDASEVPFWSKEYRQRVSVDASSTDAFATALNQAFGTIFAELAKDLAAQTLPKP